jgi:diguanylate cyclase (GGDEF)-like protein
MSDVDDPKPSGDAPEASAILSAMDAAFYAWAIPADRLTWSPALPRSLSGLGTPATGAAWNAATDPEAMTSRHSAVTGSTGRDEGHGVDYELEYPVRVPGRDGHRLVWIEDIGRWHADADGRPVRAQGLVRVVTGRHEADQRLAIHSRSDPATGTLNRARLLDTLDAMISDARRFQTSCGFVLVAIENIGALDDSPDELIAAVAKRLRASMRSGDALGRFSNATFGLALANCTAPELAVAARRFMDAVHDEPVSTAAGPIGVRVTCAGIVAPRYAGGQVEMVARVSETLAEIRRKRRGGFAAYAPSPERDERRRRNIRLAEDLVAALHEERVFLAFQPVVDAATEQVAWHEALARLRDGDGATHSISAYVDAAEKLGLIHLLDRRVLELVITALQAHPSARVAVNISAETMGDAEWREHLVATFRKRPGIAGRLLVEITETAAPGDLAEAAEFVAALRAAGVRVAIDDFGAGQTSFRALRALGVDLVKIDGDFVTDLAASVEDRAFVRAITTLARDIGFATVAERVEDPATAALLKEMGADYLQGDLFGTPGPLPKT